MIDKNMMSVFKIIIQRELKDALFGETQFFAWLCAVRALPFLGSKGHFGHWNQRDKQEYLYHILFALDCASATAYNTAFGSGNADDDAYEAAHFAHHADDDAARAVREVAHYTARSDCAAAHYAVNTTAFAAVCEADAACAAAYAAFSENADTTGLEYYRRLLLNDLRKVKNGNFRSFNHDISMYLLGYYGDIWGNFMIALHEEGCDYWANLYTDVFNSGFKVDINELKRRLSVPKEISEQGAASVGVYLENAAKQGTVYSQRETRLIILGSAGAGKTTLVRRLNGDMSFPDAEDSTHGVDTSIELNCNGTKAHIWDFGGQVIYHASHRCFMSANCVYILVVNARTEDNRDINRINYWLDTISIYSDNKAKVFIVINESDNREQNVDDYDTFREGEYAPLIQEIYSFNIGKDMLSLNTFRNDLAVYVETAGHQAFGKNDSDVLERLDVLFEQGNQVLEARKLEGLLRNCGIKSKNEQKRTRDLLNTLGVALSYEFMEGYVLDPYWISHGVYKVIDYLQKNKSKFICDNDLNVVFADERGAYPDGKKEYILDLMDHHKIGFGNTGGVRGLIVPCAASQFKPKDIKVERELDCLVTLVEREDLQEFPADFFYKYICANKDDIHKEGERWSLWQTGMVLAGEDTSALVELKEYRRIEITVWGDGKEAYSRKLELLINDLLQEYRFISYEENRTKSGRLVKNITLGIKAAAQLVIESVAKGATKALIENESTNMVKETLSHLL